MVYFFFCDEINDRSVILFYSNRWLIKYHPLFDEAVENVTGFKCDSPTTVSTYSNSINELEKSHHLQVFQSIGVPTSEKRRYSTLYSDFQEITKFSVTNKDAYKLHLMAQNAILNMMKNRKYNDNGLIQKLISMHSPSFDGKMSFNKLEVLSEETTEMELTQNNEVELTPPSDLPSQSLELLIVSKPPIQIYGHGSRSSTDLENRSSFFKKKKISRPKECKTCKMHGVTSHDHRTGNKCPFN